MSKAVKPTFLSGKRMIEICQEKDFDCCARQNILLPCMKSYFYQQGIDTGPTNLPPALSGTIPFLVSWVNTSTRALCMAPLEGVIGPYLVFLV